VMEAVSKGGVIEDFAGVVGDGADAVFGRGTVEQVAALQEEAGGSGLSGRRGGGGGGGGGGAYYVGR